MPAVNSHQQTETVGIKNPLPAVTGGYWKSEEKEEVKVENQQLLELLIQCILQMQLFLTMYFKAAIHVLGAIIRSRDFMVYFKQGQNTINGNRGEMKQVLKLVTEGDML